jgi:hypothetical protein
MTLPCVEADLPDKSLRDKVQSKYGVSLSTVADLWPNINVLGTFMQLRCLYTHSLIKEATAKLTRALSQPGAGGAFVEDLKRLGVTNFFEQSQHIHGPVPVARGGP